MPLRVFSLPTSLLPLLRAYTPTDPRETTFLERMLWLGSFSDCWHRTRYDPGHFTVSAFVFSEDAQEVALIWHPRFERWLQPGGHIEPEDPDVFETARREVKEELGVEDLKPFCTTELWDIDIHEIAAKKGEPPHQHFDLRFAFMTAQRDFKGELQARWLKLSERHRIESDASVQRGLLKVQLKKS